jgi:hypothetical protein
VSCSGCGEFAISKIAESRLQSQRNKRGLVVHFIRLAFERGERPEIRVRRASTSQVALRQNENGRRLREEAV